LELGFNHRKRLPAAGEEGMSAYSYYGSAWTRDIINDLDGEAFEIGIESDKKNRGSAVNVSVMNEDADRQLFILQVRKTDFHPRKYNRTRKDYFLCGRNENGNAFAHPVQVKSTNARVDVALMRIWDCTRSQLDGIVRQGDVALIPERTINFKTEGLERASVHEFVIGETHIVRTTSLYLLGEQAYVAGTVSIYHTKEQHPSIEELELNPVKLYRVQLGLRAKTWGFARPTAD
jgi:hypothetical protein